MIQVMEYLTCNLFWVDGRCYRHRPGIASVKQDFESRDEYSSGLLNQDEDGCDYSDVIENASGSYSTSMIIPSALCGVVIGAKGATKKRIEQETKTHISVPPQGKHGKTGRIRSGVAAARRQIKIIVVAARRRQEATHFISIPLNDPVISERFSVFKQSILANNKSDREFLSSIFQKPKKLHLTIGTMVLLNGTERENACKVLQSCLENVVRPLLNSEHLRVKVEGIEYMNDDPGEVDVLYAKVSVQNGSDRQLQLLADGLVDHFVSNEIMDKEYESVKLHATLMNTIFNKQQGGVEDVRRRRSFNARDILKNFRDFDFGECVISEIHLSQRHSEGKDGYYSSTAKLCL